MTLVAISQAVSKQCWQKVSKIWFVLVNRLVRKVYLNELIQISVRESSRVFYRIIYVNALVH